MKKKPKPLKKGLANRPKKETKAPIPDEAPQAFNEVSPITVKQIQRAERAIDNLREEVKDLRKAPPAVKVEATQPEVVVNIPERPRIGKVKIKYDPFGMPEELIPEYVEG